jgi:uncharacterized protein DUF11
MQTREREGRDSIILILLILLFGFMCIILASGWALRFAPSWRLPANMNSNLNPNVDFLTGRPVSFIEPLDPAILTNPVWIDVFLTPGASFTTRTPLPTGTLTSTPVKTSTPRPPQTASPTSTKIIIIPATKTGLPTAGGPTSTRTATRTSTSIAAVTYTATVTSTFTSTRTPTSTTTYTATSTPTFTPTRTPTNTPASVADLQITKTDNAANYAANGSVQYSIVVSNPTGPANIVGATVTDTFSTNPNLTGTTTWTCTAFGGASCTASGSNDLNDTAVNLPVGTSVRYTVNVTVIATPSGDLINTATVSVPGGFTDPNPANNSATDTDTLVPPEIGTGPDGIVYYLPANGTLTLDFNVVVNGHASWDIVYYELPGAGGIFLDMIKIEIGDGQNWYPVFNWGNNIADTNTNADFNILSNPQVPEEPDERFIPGAELYNTTGIAIDLDSVVPPGTYSYIRFYAPPDALDNHAEIDGVVVLP